MSTDQPGPRWAYPASGVLAALLGAGVGHLIAGLTYPAASPLLVLGATVVEASPTTLQEWAIQTFGSADKIVLLGSVAAVTVALAALAGWIGRRRRTAGLTTLGALGATGVIAAWLLPAAATIDALPSLVATVAAVAVMWFLHRAADSVGVVSEQSRGETSGVERPTDHNARATGEAWTTGRRGFLTGAAGAVVVGAAGGLIGRELAASHLMLTAADLPAPADPLPPLPAGLETTHAGISAFRTPIKDFYRVDTALVVPRVDLQSWRLVIDGDVEHELSFSLDDILAMPMIEKDITMTCVSNDVGGRYIGSARWLGVPVRMLLQKAVPRSTADQILSTSHDGMTISTPIAALLDDRDALLAVGMNGQPLPPAHGFPARLITPGLYGFVGSTKWVTRLTATTYGDRQAYWTKRGWAVQAPVLTQARIDTPGDGATRPRGQITIGGVAWAQQRGIERVEISIDDGPWIEVTLGPDAGIDYWRQWFYRWDASPGEHTITVRATDGAGLTQPSGRSDPFPQGASGHHEITIEIE